MFSRIGFIQATLPGISSQGSKAMSEIAKAILLANGIDL
jgi:hypothetical protein